MTKTMQRKEQGWKNMKCRKKRKQIHCRLKQREEGADEEDEETERGKEQGDVEVSRTVARSRGKEAEQSQK